MAKASFRLKQRLPLPEKQMAFIKTEAVKGLQPVVNRRVGEYENPTRNWKPEHKPDFQGQVIFSKRQGIYVRVIIKNYQTVFNKYGTKIGKLWEYWNRGTGIHGPYKQAYDIFPRFAKVLRFVKNGKIIFAKYIKNHPGMKGSGHKESVDKRLRPFEKKSIDRVLRVAFKRLNKVR